MTLDTRADASPELDSRVHELLSAWEQAAVKPSLEVLCAGNPDLLPRVKSALAGMAAADGRLFETSEAPTATTAAPLPSRSLADPALLPGRIGKYTITAALPSGGQAKVYRAVHPELAAEVVVKMYHAGARFPVGEVGAGSAAPGTLAAEGRLLAQLSHPNIARVLDLDYDTGRPFLVMEFVRGRNLRQYAGGSALPPRRAAELVAQAARGLGAAHRAGVVHLDVKPHNLVVDDAGGLKVIDFGVARFRGAMQEDVVPGVSGTLLYFAPEQARGQDELLDSRTDVFSLGCVLYYLLSGQDAYGGVGPANLMSRLREGAFVRAPLERGSAMPAALRAICLKAMSPDRASRYADGDAMAADLEAFCRGPPDERGAARRFAGRGRRVVAVIAALFAVLAVVGAVLLPKWFGHDSAAQDARDARPAANVSPPPTPGVNRGVKPLPTTPVVSIRTEVLREDGWLSLGQAGPLADGMKIRIECDVPAGLYASLLLLDPQGQLEELARLNAASADRRLHYPAPGQAVPLNEPSGTELLFVVARQAGPLDVDDLRSNFPWKGGCPRLKAGTVLRLREGQVETLAEDRGLGAPVEAGEPTDQTRRRLEELRRWADERGQVVSALAFPHAASSRPPP